MNLFVKCNQNYFSVISITLHVLFLFFCYFILNSYHVTQNVILFLIVNFNCIIIKQNEFPYRFQFIFVFMF